jgi:hypothetical protein
VAHVLSLIEPHRTYEFVVMGKMLTKDLNNLGQNATIKAYIKVRDELGNSYKSKLTTFFIDELAEER